VFDIITTRTNKCTQ